MKNKKSELDKYKELIRQCSTKSIYSDQETKELLKEAQNGNMESREKLFFDNQGLVIDIAKKYKINNYDLLDLIQEGNSGLLIAIDRFDLNYDVQFSTYATRWIKNKIQHALVESYDIPSHLVYEVFSFIKKENELENKLRRKPTEEELEEFTNIPIKKIRKYKKVKLGMERISLYTPIHESDNSLYIMDTIKDNEQNFTEDIVINKTLIPVIREYIDNSKLKEFEKIVIKMHFGIGYDRPYTLTEIGKIYNKTKERIRQIKDNALVVLKFSNKNKDIIIYSENQPDLKKLHEEAALKGGYRK